MKVSLTNNYKVAIVGRPNVGKSSLFNRLLGSRIAIVDSQSGITRDRVFGKVIKGSKSFDLIDTGGFFEGAENSLEVALLEQISEAISEADLVLFITDVFMGLHPMDKQIYLNLKVSNKPIIFVINKVDNANLENSIYDFLELGVDIFFPVSALHNRGMHALEKQILKMIPHKSEKNTEGFKISIIGKPNVGKSSLINKILNCNRTIINESPGTTRDAISIDFNYQDKPYTFIDTAGLTRRSRLKAPVDAYSIMRAQDAIKSSDLVILMLDADRHVESQDVRIARMINKMGKCAILLVNKWDLVKGVRQEHYKRYILERIPFIGFFPILFTSVKQNKNLNKVMDLVTELKATAFKRIPTALLNQVIKDAYQRNLPPFIGGGRLKIYYATQVSESPPTFALFINSTQKVVQHYLKYLENQIRFAFEFQGMPIHFKLKNKK